MREGVVLLDEAELGVNHLPGQPVVAVDVDLDGKREPSLQADVDQAELRIEEVEVQHPLRPTSEDEPRTFRAVQQLHRAASFHAAEDGDQAFGDAARSDVLGNEGFLALVALQKLIRRLRFPRQGLGVVHERLRLLLDPGQEILAPHAEFAIDKGVEIPVGAEGEMTLENHSIMATQRRYNRIGELLREVEARRHGVLLPEA